MEEKKRTPYSIMKSAVDKTFVPTEEEKKRVNSFFLVRFISNDPSTIYIANTLNCYVKNIPVEAQYRFVRNSTMDKINYINYPKKERIVSDKELNIISYHFKCNNSIAREYVEIMGYDRAIEIVEKYKGIKIVL
jgi:hypothetical protein